MTQNRILDLYWHRKHFMKKRILFALILNTVILLCATASAFAQSNGTNGSSIGSANRKPEPFASGETLSYEVKLSKAILRGVNVADLNFTVGEASNGKDYLLKAEAKSKGTLTKLFRVSFYQTFDSTVEAENFRVLKTVKRDEQDERVRESEAFFDYRDRRVTYIETDPNDRMRPPRRIASSIEDSIAHDLISGIYNLRRLPLAVGKTFQILISDSGLVYKVPVRVTAREQQSTVLGKVWCFRIEPEVFGANRIVEQKGSMIIWITDDSKRIPVRSQINTPRFKAEVKLKKAD